MSQMTTNDLNEINRSDLTRQAISYLGLKTKNKVTSYTEEVKVHCPFHKDNTPSLFINVKHGIFKCFSCGRKGSIESLFKEMTGDNLYHALGLTTNKPTQFSSLARNMNNDYDYDSDKLKKKSVYMNFNEKDFVPATSNNLSLRYLYRRGITAEIADSVGMMYCESTRINTTLFKNRLCIPIYENGNLCSIEGRKILSSEEGPKVLYPKNTSVNLLYDIDNLDRNSTLYACEGLMDLMLLRTCNEFKNSTSIFGASLTDRQLSQLSEFKDIVYIPDNDEAGEGVVTKLLESGISGLSVLRLPKEINGVQIKDIGDLPKAGVTVNDLYNRRWLNHIKNLTN